MAVAVALAKAWRETHWGEESWLEEASSYTCSTGGRSQASRWPGVGAPGDLPRPALRSGSTRRVLGDQGPSLSLCRWETEAREQRGREGSQQAHPHATSH